MRGHSDRALVVAVDDAGLEYKIEAPLEAVRGVGEGVEHVLMLAWSIHALPPALRPPEPAASPAAVAPLAEPRSSASGIGAPTPPAPAAGSPGWQLIAYAGTLNGSPIAPGELPRDGGPMWPDDDDTRTAAAIEKKIEEVFRYGRFEGLRWRGASDAWVEKWWPRFEVAIAEGLAKSHQREKVPVVDTEGLAIAEGAEIRGATILPPTRAGWQRFLELAPASGESFTVLKDIGLSWWGSKVPQDLLSKERKLLRELIVPRMLADTAYSNARENSDPQNARFEHDAALGRVMLALFTEDSEAHGDLPRRYSDDEAWRRSLHEQSFAATYPPEGKPDAAKAKKGAATADEPRITDEQWVQLQTLFDDGTRRDRADAPEDIDRRVIDNLFLQRAAMGDALAIAGMGKREQAQQAQQAMQTAYRITVLRAEASVLQGRGYGVSLTGAPERAFNLIGLAGHVLAVRLIAPADKVVFAPGMDPETRARIDRDVDHARRVVEEIMQEENAKAGPLTEEIMLAVWRRARQVGDPGDAGGERVATERPAPVAPETSPPAAGDASMTLHIERPATNQLRAMAIRKSVESFDEASREYRAAVDASGEGASTFPRGLVVLPDGQEYEVSYNGRVWSGDRLVFDPAKSSAAPAEPPTRKIDQAHEEARSALKRLGLPVKQHVKYLRQVDEAIASGKSYIPIIERARKAAEKLTEGRRTRTTGRDTTRAAPPPRRILDAALDTFNAEPRWRLALHNTLPNGWVLVVHPEDKDPDAAVAAIDVIMENVDDVRWLDDRLPQADQNAIMDRLDRALWAAFEVREGQEAADEEKTEIPSPLQGLIELMERRSKALGARPELSRDLGRTDGYQEIARALQDLAVPSGIGAEELQKWLESHDLMAAGDLIARARVEPMPVSRLMRDLWDSLLDAFEVAEVKEEGGVLRVPENAIHAIAGHDTILERVMSGDAATLRHVRVTPGEVDEDGTVTIDDPTDRLAPGAVVHLRGASERELVELYRTIQAFYHNLAVAPKTLQDVRTLLYWTAVMLDAPRCQGEVKSRASTAFEQAKQYYNTARWRLMDGVSVDAVRRMHEALRRISAAAAEIARSCGEGQIDIAVTPPPLPVTPEDRAAILDEQVEERS